MQIGLVEMPAADYHADPCPVPSLSASIASILVSRSPIHAWLAHPRLGGQPRQPTDDMDNGTLIHSLVLGAGGEVEVIEADDYRTKAAKEARDNARVSGRLPVLAAKYESARVVAGEICARLLEYGIELTGQSEMVARWNEESSRGPVACRARMDHVLLDRGVIYDLKTTRSADPRKCARSMVEYGYDIQWAAYTSALRSIDPNLAGREDFIFLFAETEPPYCVTPARPDGAMRQLGQQRWWRAVETWSACMESGKWPGYVNGIVNLEPPSWAVYQEENAQEAA